MRMKRTRKTKTITTKPADAILVSDMHLTDSIPVSRIDNYLLAQRSKLQFLQSLSAQNNNCPILCAGDIFNHWKASPWLCGIAYRHLPRPFIGIPGQHDLPEHSLKQYERSALGLLEAVSDEEEFIILRQMGEQIQRKNLRIVGIPFGELRNFEPDESLKFALPDLRRILILHELTWQGKKPSWDKGSRTDIELINEFGNYFDLILTGDNHEGFVARQKDPLHSPRDCILVNPGSMMRRTADQADYQPRCYLYYADENDAVPVYFPIEMNVHTREHIDKEKERDERIAAYIERIKKNWEAGLSFRKNLELFFRENKVPRKIKEIIYNALEKEG